VRAALPLWRDCALLREARRNPANVSVAREGSRIQGFEDSSELLKNYEALNVWQKSYELCLKINGIITEFPNDERYGLPWIS
jgi:hypothetical protein